MWGETKCSHTYRNIQRSKRQTASKANIIVGFRETGRNDLVPLLFTGLINTKSTIAREAFPLSYLAQRETLELPA